MIVLLAWRCYISSTFQISLAEKFKFDHDLSFLVEYENCFTPQVILEMGDWNSGKISNVTAFMPFEKFYLKQLR